MLAQFHQLKIISLLILGLSLVCPGIGQAEAQLAPQFNYGKKGSTFICLRNKRGKWRPLRVNARGKNVNPFRRIKRQIRENPLRLKRLKRKLRRKKKDLRARCAAAAIAEPAFCTTNPEPGAGVLAQKIGPIKLNAYVPFGGSATTTDNRNLTIYVNSGGQEHFGLEIEKSMSWHPQKVFVEVVDPQGSYQHIRYTDDLEEGLEVNHPLTRRFDRTICFEQAGVYQINILSANSNVTFYGSSSLEYGVNFRDTYQRYFPGHPEQAYIYAPQNLRAPLWIEVGTEAAERNFRLRNLDDPLGAEPDQVKINEDRTTRFVVEPSRTASGQIWEFTPLSEEYSFHSKGFPLVFANSIRAAQAIKAGLHRIEAGPMSGMLVSNKYQQKLAELIPVILRSVDPEDQSSIEPAIRQFRDNCQPENLSTEELNLFSKWITPYSGILPSATSNFHNSEKVPAQIVNAESIWPGAIGTNEFGSQLCATDQDCLNRSSCTGAKVCSRAFTPDEYPWDVFRSLRFNRQSPWGGFSSSTRAQSQMFYLASFAHHCNYYHGSQSLAARALSSLMFDVLALDHQGSFPDTRSAFEANLRSLLTAPAFGYINPRVQNFFPELSSEISALLTHAYQGVFHNLFGFPLAGARNQSSPFPEIAQNIAEGITDTQSSAFYIQLTRRWTRNLTDQAGAGGWHPEAYGPDASYNGITHNHLGLYYRLTEDDAAGPDTEIFDNLRQSYNFYNQSMVYEPGGGFLAGCPYSHRTTLCTDREQYSGAKGLMNLVPEVAVRTNRGKEGRLLADYTRDLAQFQRYRPASQGNRNVSKLLFPAESSYQRSQTLLPHEEQGSFIRENGAMISVNRPGYYVSIYAGAPGMAGGATSVRKRFQFQGDIADGKGKSRNEFTSDDLNLLPDQVRNNVSFVAPYNNGGITVLSFKKYGAAVLAANWHPLTHHGLVADLNNGKRYWEDYNSIEYSLDRQANTLRVTGGIDELPLSFIRIYNFDQDKIRVQLTVRASADVNLRSLRENLPLATCSRTDCSANAKNRGSAVYYGSYRPTRNYSQTRSDFSLRNRVNQSALFKFDRSLKLETFPNGFREINYGNEKQISSVLAHLPRLLSRNQSYSFSYTIAGD